MLDIYFILSQATNYNLDYILNLFDLLNPTFTLLPPHYNKIFITNNN